VIYIAQTR